MILDENLFEDVDLATQQSKKMVDVEAKAEETQNPVYADATRQMKKTAKVKDETVKVEAEPKHEEKAKNPKMAAGAKKMQLDESLFESASYEEEYEEGICPNCGTVLEYARGPIFKDSEMAYYDCICENCGKRVREIYDIQLNFSHFEANDLTESVEGDKMMQDMIDDKNANFEADKQTTREVRKELAKQGIATNTDGEPIKEAFDNSVEYKGYAIEYNFYGEGEYTVQYQGDDVWFKSMDAAQEFIDEITATDLPILPNENAECECGNMTHTDGFHPCNKEGELVEPDENWNGLYKCAKCGKIYVGQEFVAPKPMYESTEERKSQISYDHLAKVKAYIAQEGMDANATLDMLIDWADSIGKLRHFGDLIESLAERCEEFINEGLYHAQEVFTDEENKTFAKSELGMVDKDKLSDEDRRMIARRKLGLDKKTVYIDPKDSMTPEERREYARQELGLKPKKNLSETLDETSKSNWRGVEGVKLIDHGAYSDPELFYKDSDGTKYIANYWNVEDSMWEYFLEETGHKDAESGQPEVEAAFDKFCQEHRDLVINDIMNMAEGEPVGECLKEELLDPKYEATVGTYGWDYQASHTGSLEDVINFINTSLAESDQYVALYISVLDENEELEDWILDGAKDVNGEWHLTPNTSDSYRMIDGKLVRNALGD